MTAFPLELDHLVIFTAADAPEAKHLEALGVQGFGGTTQHGDLGTASTSFFFSNTYLELFWVQDAKALEPNLGGLGHDPRDRMNWRTTGASPFSITTRWRNDAKDASRSLPCPATSLPASWMPGDIAIRFMSLSAAEPVCGVIPDPLQFLSWQQNIPEQHHPLGVKTLTGIHITVVAPALSPLAEALNQAGIVTIECGAEPLMMLTFDNNAQGKTVDVRPILPLVLKG